MSVNEKISQEDSLGPEKVLSRYIIDVAMILLCLLASFAATMMVTEHAEYSGSVINTSGKQRMLSQRILYLSQRKLNDDDYSAAIKAAIDEFERAHARLISSELVDETLQRIYFGPDEKGSLNARVLQFVERARRVADHIGPGYEQQLENLHAIDTEALLDGLDQSVSGFEAAASKKARTYETIQVVTFIVAILIIVLEAVFIVRPALKKLRRAIDQERQLVEIQSNFLTKMSHEMRTPLNAIIGFGEALNAGIYGRMNDKQQNRLKDIHDSGKHLLTLVSDLMDLSKVARDEVLIELTNENVCDLVEYVCRTLAECANAKGVRILLDAEDCECVEARVDANRAKQCLINILENAIKFSPEGADVAISIADQDEHVDVSIRDQGPGLSAEEIEVAMRLFGQVDQKKYVAANGLGVGLSLTSKLMEKQGGHMHLQSAPNSGTEVALRFRAA